MGKLSDRRELKVCDLLTEEQIICYINRLLHGKPNTL